ncbi:hypothetical protein FocnCong_v021441 [Fusarium oxysporum f. sp. conglutinans]|nr:hypothetical protein FocnCong_v021441 [Fusarium oxysporum f. sp. conglutinans]
METESLSDLFRRLDARNRENVALAGLGIRTSADIFEATQSQYEHSRSQRNAAYGGSVVSPALADLGIRTSADILEALNGENGQKSGDMSSRRRHRLHRKPGIMSSGQGQVVDSAEGTVENGPQEEPRHRSELKRSGPRSDDGQLPHKRPRTVERQERSESEQVQDLANVLGVLEEDFAEKERLSDDQTWCTPVSHERKAKTVEEFYKAFHDMRTLPVLTCMFCYRKHSRAELQYVDWDWWVANAIEKRDGSPFKCVQCFPVGQKILGCGDCVRHLGRGALSAAARLHTQLGCEHMFPDELKDLTPVEEKLIALNSCYGFITKHSVSDGHRQGATYPRHVKGHITVFPNNVQELATNVLPHPLLKVMDDVHISWQGQEKPAPSDLSTLLSVRRNAVEKALLWLKRYNPLCANIEIDEAELDSWDAPSHGVPSQVFDRLERNEPSAREKMHTAHIVPPTERDIDDHEPVDIQEIMASLAEGLSTSGEPEVDGFASGEDGDDWVGNNRDRVDETESSGMFNLDGRPDIPDAEKLRYLVKSMGEAEEHSKDATGQVHPIFELEAAAQHLVSSRNMSLEAWVKMVIQRHGGRFATHPVFPFPVFNIGVRSRNRRVSMASMRRSDFPDVERTIQDLTASRLEKARGELEACGKTADPDVNRLLRNLSLYGYRQPMSRESRLTMRRKIKSLIIRYGIPAIWFTLNPNDITNPIKLKLAAYRTRETGGAEEYLRSLDQAYKRARLAISDPLSSAIFFHREISMFFQYYVMVGKDSVFGRVSQYYGAVETNERGALHLHGLLWLQGNMYLSSLLSDVQGEEQAAYRQRVTEYVDSVFTEDLDEESFARVRAGRSVTSDVSSLLERAFQFPPTFEEEANFCAGATQIHTHSPTCVKYAIGRRGTKQNPCRFGAPWKPVEKTYFDEDGLLRLRRSHSLVNRWNKVMAVGLRHNHDISFIVTKFEQRARSNRGRQPSQPSAPISAANGQQNLHGTGVVAGRGVGPFSGIRDRTYKQHRLDVSERLHSLLAHFPAMAPPAPCGRRGRAGRVDRGDGAAGKSRTEDLAVASLPVPRSATGRVSSLRLYVGRQIEAEGGCVRSGEVELDRAWPLSASWIQTLRHPNQLAAVCLDGYLGMDFTEEDDSYYRRIWETQKTCLSKRMTWLADNIQLLRRSAEDVARDARQWAALSGEGDPTADAVGSGSTEGHDAQGVEHRPGGVGLATRLIDVLRNAMTRKEITAGSKEISSMVEQMYRFQATALDSTDDLRATVIPDHDAHILGGSISRAEIPRQEQLRSIKSQQNGLSREREKMIQGLQNQLGGTAAADGVAAHSGSDRPGQQDDPTTHADQRAHLGIRVHRRALCSAHPHPFARPEGKWPSPSHSTKDKA